MEEGIQEAAEIMIRNYGKNAGREAAFWVEKAAEQGDAEGERIWRHIARAVELLSTRPS